MPIFIKNYVFFFKRSRRRNSNLPASSHTCKVQVFTPAHRVKEGTASVQLLFSGLSDGWCSGAMDAVAFLGNIQDRLANGRTPREKISNALFSGPIIPLEQTIPTHPYKMLSGGCTANAMQMDTGRETCSLRTGTISRRVSRQKSTSKEPSPRTPKSPGHM